MGKASAQVTVTIDRPVAEVFAVLSDYNKNVLWQDGLVSSRQVSPGEPGVGTEVSYKRQVMGREIEGTSTMTAFTQDQTIRIRAASKLYSYEGGYDLSEVGGSTQVRYVGEIVTSRLLGPVGKMLAGNFEKQMLGDLGRLKNMLEAGDLSS